MVGLCPLPEVHADKLLSHLVVDEDFAGQPAAVQALRKFYLLVCRMEGARPFPWPTIVRALNRRLQAIYGPATYRTYKNLPATNGRKKRLTYRVPTAAEVQAAIAAKDDPSIVPLHQRG